MPRGGAVYRHEMIQSSVRGTAPDKSLVASAQVFNHGPGAQKLRRVGERTRSREFQNELWDMYDAVPEFHSACTWVGNLLSLAKITVRFRGEETKNQVALDALASLFDGEEGQEEMLRLLGVHFTVAGECFVIGSPGKDKDEWTVAASIEVSEQSEIVTVEGEELPEYSLPIRLWKAHPRRTKEADSPARSLLPTLQQIVRLTEVINAQADSRLKGNGILFVPSELEMPAIPVTTEEIDGDELTSLEETSSVSAGVTQRLIQIASIAMRDRDSAAAGVPLVIAAPGEYLEKVNWVDFWTGFDEHVKELREEAVIRIARSMDMPPEALTGTGEMNHWGAWQVEESSIKVHTEPLLAIILRSLTVGYLHPWLASQNVPDYLDYTFEADTTKLRLRPNRSKEALELFDRGELSARTLLTECGFDPEVDAPDKEERVMLFLRQMVEKTSISPEQVASVLAKLGIGGIPDGTGEENGGTVEQRRSLEEHPTRDLPEDSRQASGVVVVDGLVVGAEQAVYRALERAGNRIRVKVGSKVGSTAADAYLSVPHLDVVECERLLEDAWTSVDRLASHVGVAPEVLRDSLNEYTLMLLRAQKPLTTSSLARHLMLDLADEAA